MPSNKSPQSLGGVAGAMKKRHVIFAVAAVALLVAGYVVGWHTSVRRIVRGICSVVVTNNSGRELPYVSFYLFDDRGEQIMRHCGPLQPGHSVIIRVRTSDLIVRRIFCDEGQNPITYEDGRNVTAGKLLVVSVDSHGKMREAYPH